MAASTAELELCAAAAQVRFPPSALAFATYTRMFLLNFLALALLFVLYMFSFVQRFE